MAELKQWHPAFRSAVKLELRENKNDLEFNSEFPLNEKPIQIDLLVITKSPDAEVKNEIGRIFRGHNIFEYKSPEAALNIDTFFKTIAYASLYKSMGKAEDSIKAEDITISLVREGKPVELIRKLESAGMKVRKAYDGIYYVDCGFFFGIQIIVTKELNKDTHLWLMSLTKKLSKEDAEQLIQNAVRLKDKDEKEYADSVFQVVVKANPKIFEEVKEVFDMYEALKELMKPEFDKAISEAEEKGMEKGEKRGENLLASLINKLISLGRNEDIPKVTNDSDYREALYIQYGLKKSV